MTFTLKRIATIILLCAIAIYAVPIVLEIICRPVPENILSYGNFISKGAFPIWVIGSCIYAKSIGYSYFWGLLGLSGIGFIVLMFFPDRSSNTAEQDAAANP